MFGSLDSRRVIMEQDTGAYLLAKFNDGSPFSGVHPLQLHRDIKSLIGSVKTAKPIKSGALLIQTLSSAQTKLLLESKELLGKLITVEIADRLNSVEAVAYAPSLRTVSDDELLEECKLQGVIGIRRLRPRQDGTPNHLVRFRFRGLRYPESITIGFEVLRLRLWVQPPPLCRRCAKFGHTIKTCQSRTTQNGRLHRGGPVLPPLWRPPCSMAAGVPCTPRSAGACRGRAARCCRPPDQAQAHNLRGGSSGPASTCSARGGSSGPASTCSAAQEAGPSRARRCLSSRKKDNGHGGPDRARAKPRTRTSHLRSWHADSCCSSDHLSVSRCPDGHRDHHDRRSSDINSPRRRRRRQRDLLSAADTRTARVLACQLGTAPTPARQREPAHLLPLLAQRRAETRRRAKVTRLLDPALMTSPTKQLYHVDRKL